MIELPPLPYALDALAPFISKQTLDFHYNKHHAAYVKTTNDLIANTDMQDKSLSDIVLESAADAVFSKLFNNAAQAWNHGFFWNSLTPYQQNQQIPDDLQTQIIADFGSVEQMKSDLKAAAVGRFGSGWAWLVSDAGTLKVISTSNAETPLTQGNLVPLLCIDVWEHAYYLDYQNRRADFVDSVINHLLNWQFAYQNWKGQ